MGTKRTYKGQTFFESNHAYRKRKKAEKAFNAFIRDVGKISKQIEKALNGKQKSARLKKYDSRRNAPSQDRPLLSTEKENINLKASFGSQEILSNQEKQFSLNQLKNGDPQHTEEENIALAVSSINVEPRRGGATKEIREDEASTGFSELPFIGKISYILGFALFFLLLIGLPLIFIWLVIRFFLSL